MEKLSTAAHLTVTGAYVLVWDILLVVGNSVWPKRTIENIVPEGHPGFKGHWPEYISAKDGDSRCSCPGLNALANHGILPRDGKNVSFKEITDKIQTTYNFAPTFCLLLSSFSAALAAKTFTEKFDLKDLDEHNAIEHDGSLIREDAYFEPDQSKIAAKPIEDLLSRATGRDKNGQPFLTSSDLAKALSDRFADSRMRNPQFHTNLLHQLFAAGNATMILSGFGEDTPALRAFLLEERLAEGWIPWDDSPFGVTVASFNGVSLGVAIKMWKDNKAAAAKKTN